MTENDLANRIMDASFVIHRELGPGLLESVYETVLARQLLDLGLAVQRQVPVPIRFRGMTFEEGFRADLVVENKVVDERLPAFHQRDGIVNPHTHLELTHFPAWKLRKGIDYAPRTYVDWVIQVIKTRRALTHGELTSSIREGIYRLLECGTTMVGEIMTDLSMLPVYRHYPMRGRLFGEALGQDQARCIPLLGALDAMLSSFDADRFEAGLSPHAPHTLSSDFFRDVVELAQRHRVPTVIHLAESPEETAFIADGRGPIADLLYPFAGWERHLSGPRFVTPTAYLDSLGVLGPTTTAVHCVHVTPADAHILKEREVCVILCPRSNDRLVVGKAPAALLKKAGIPLALGTDSLASNDSLSQWDEMRFLLETFPGVFSAAEALEMATLGAARALRLEGEAGSLEAGKRADFLVVKPARLGSSGQLVDSLVADNRVEQLYLAGEPLSFETLDGYSKAGSETSSA